MSRPKLDLPLKDHNSPRSQWISNVSLLKNQLKDGELFDNETVAGSKMSWIELEAKLSKRMKDPSFVVPPSRNFTPKSKTAQNDTIPISPNNLNLIRHPHHRSKLVSPSNHSIASSKRPTLKIPTSEKSKEILKQIHRSGKTPMLSEAQRLSLSSTIQKDSVDHSKVSVLQGRTPTTHVLSQNESFYDDSPNHQTTSVALAKTSTYESKKPTNSTNISSSATPIVEIEKISERRENIPLVYKTETKEEEKGTTHGLKSIPTTHNKARVETIEKACVPVATPPFCDEASFVTSRATVQTNDSFALPNRKFRREQKTKGSLSWLRRALKPHDTVAKKTIQQESHITPGSTFSVKDEEKMEETLQTIPSDDFKPTTPLQLGLWLSELQKAIRVAQHEQQKVNAPMNSVNSTNASPRNEESINEHDDVENIEEDLYYKKNRDVGVYVDYSTFDDGDSVSSLELLFKWLTCRDLNDSGNKRNESPMTPPGTVMATESNVSDDISIDMDLKPTRRTFFAR